MAFISSLNQDDYSKKPGDLIKSADWNALGGEVVSLGKAKLDRDGDTIQGELTVNGPLRVGDVIEAKQYVVQPAREGDATGGLRLGAADDPAWGLYRSDAGAKKSLAGKTAVAGDNFSGQALRIRTEADANSGLIVENQQDQLNFSVRGSELTLNGQGGGVGNNNKAARALFDGGVTDGLVINYGNDFGKVSIQSEVTVNGPVRAAAFISSNPMIHRMYPGDPLVYQNIFDAVRAGALAKLGNPAYDDTTYSEAAKRFWGERYIIRFGGDNEADGNGAVVVIPPGYDTVWVRIQGNKWDVIKAYFLDGDGKDLGLWVGGYRSHSICPDGSLADGYMERSGSSTIYSIYHQWLAIPAGRAGRLALIPKTGTSDSFWLSGLGFSKNPWAHSTQSARSYSSGLNGSEAAGWGGERLHGDLIGELRAKSNVALRVPIVPSGRDKLFYLVGLSRPASAGSQNLGGRTYIEHTGIAVNGRPIERLLATYDNPFARYWNSRLYCHYSAARIPAADIPPNERYLKVQIDTSKQSYGIHFREIGTHDMDVPTNY